MFGCIFNQSKPLLNGKELWVYDGINDPFLFYNISTSEQIPYIGDYIEFSNSIYFSANDGIHGLELWEYNGIDNPHMLMDINTGPFGACPSNLYIDILKVVYKGKLFFNATDGVSGNELWVYDGINAPTMVAILKQVQIALTL